MRSFAPRLLLAALVAISVTSAAPAAAAVGISSFAVTPAATQAGDHPNLRMQVALSATDGDDARDMTISLAPGLLADPTAVAACTQAQLDAAACPASSQVGQGTLNATATVVVLPVPISAPAEVYVVEPQPGEAARLGLVSRPPLVASIVSTGAAKLRSTPDVGLDVTFAGLPRTASGLPITIDSIDLTLNGTVGDDRAFTRNPTSCSPAVTRVQVVSYDTPGSPATGSSSFTPTGCAGLDYSPSLSAVAVADAATQGVELTATVAQDPGEAATRRVDLTLPAAATPRLSELGRVCAEANPLDCPETSVVGSATADVPLIPAPVVGKLVLMQGAGLLPDLAIVLPDPLPLQLRGTSSLAGGSLVTTFDGVPDAPIERLDVKLDGGAKSLIQVLGPELCAAKPPLTARLTSHSGVEAAVSGSLAVTGTCPGAGGGGGMPTPVATPTPTPTPAAPTVGTLPGGSGAPPAATRPSARLSLRGLSGRKPRLSLTITVPPAGAALVGLDLRLPRGLTLNRRARRGFSLAANGRRVSGAVRSSSRVRAALPDARSVVVVLGRPSLRVSRSLRAQVRRRRRPEAHGSRGAGQHVRSDSEGGGAGDGAVSLGLARLGGAGYAGVMRGAYRQRRHRRGESGSRASPRDAWSAFGSNLIDLVMRFAATSTRPPLSGGLIDLA